MPFTVPYGVDEGHYVASERSRRIESKALGRGMYRNAWSEKVPDGTCHAVEKHATVPAVLPWMMWFPLSTNHGDEALGWTGVGRVRGPSPCRDMAAAPLSGLLLCVSPDHSRHRVS